MLGAHVSSQGGVVAAPGRGGALRASAIQLFTKTRTNGATVTETATVERFLHEAAGIA